jgi:hypothetical protein
VFAGQVEPTQTGDIGQILFQKCLTKPHPGAVNHNSDIVPFKQSREKSLMFAHAEAFNARAGFCVNQLSDRASVKNTIDIEKQHFTTWFHNTPFNDKTGKPFRLAGLSGRTSGCVVHRFSKFQRGLIRKPGYLRVLRIERRLFRCVDLLNCFVDIDTQNCFTFEHLVRQV